MDEPRARRRTSVADVLHGVWNVHLWARRTIFPRAFPNWFLAGLFGSVITLFGALLVFVPLLALFKIEWIPALIGAACLWLGISLLRYAGSLRRP